jgi:hypothetical protein
VPACNVAHRRPRRHTPSHAHQADASSEGEQCASTPPPPLAHAYLSTRRARHLFARNAYLSTGRGADW